jgi:hypothetical protein
MLNSTKLVLLLLLFMLLVEESSRIIRHRKPWQHHHPCLIKPLGIYYMLTSIAMINWFNATVCYNNLPTIIVLGWVGLLNYGCKVYVLLYTQDTQHRIGHPLCFGTIVDPKENNALELWEAKTHHPRPHHLGLPILWYTLCFLLHLLLYFYLNSKKLLVEFFFLI